MWRIVQRAVRGQLTVPPRCQAPQVISREEEQEVHHIVVQLPRLQTRPLTDYSNHRYRSDQRRQQHDGQWEKGRSGREGWPGGDAEAEWREWLRTFRSPHQPHGGVEALGWGTALVLGIQLSQMWHGKYAKKYGEEERSCFVKYMDSLSLAIPQVYAGLFSAQSQAQKFIFPANNKLCITGLESVDALKPDVDTGQDRECNGDNQSCPALHTKRKPRLEQDAVAFLLGEKSRYPIVELTGDSSSSSTSHQENCLAPTAHSSHVNAPPPTTTPPQQQEEDFASGWEHLTSLYTNMRSNSVAQQLAAAGEYREAVLLWNTASKHGYSKANYNLALCYEHGKGVEKDVKKAVEYYTQAANAGHAKALYNLAVMYLQGEGGLCTDTDRAITLLEQAAEHGLQEAQVELGVLYTQESREDFLRASQLFEMAAKKKNRAGQFYLGMCYELGWGVQRNECKAGELYRKAASAGHTGAIFCLAAMFENGLGGLPEDVTEARVLYETAAEKGHVLAKESSRRLGETSWGSHAVDEGVKPVDSRSGLSPVSSTSSLSSWDDKDSVHSSELLQWQASTDAHACSDQSRVTFNVGDCDESSNCDSMESDSHWGFSFLDGGFGETSWLNMGSSRPVNKSYSAGDLQMSDSSHDLRAVACI